MDLLCVSDKPNYPLKRKIHYFVYKENINFMQSFIRKEMIF